jgi:hypothetical protein
MKNNIKVFALAAAFLIGTTTSSMAQNKAGKLDDLGRIVLNSYVSDDVGDMSSSAKKMLGNKLGQIVTKNGIGGSSLNPKFILTPTVTVMSKDLTATAPPMTALVLDVTLYIGDGIEGTKFASTSIQVKGVGTNETKAYISALKRISSKNSDIADFITEGKTKIMAYYNTKCDFIIKEAKVLEDANQYDAAILKLSSVPDVCKECYEKCLDAIGPIYQKQIDRECTIKLTEAKNHWSAAQDENAAKSASRHLSKIDPEAACYDEAQALAAQIGKKVKELNDRDWDFKMKKYEDGVDIAKKRIAAAKAVGVAYGNNQPKAVTYNTSGWW